MSRTPGRHQQHSTNQKATSSCFRSCTIPARNIMCSWPVITLQCNSNALRFQSTSSLIMCSCISVSCLFITTCVAAPRRRRSPPT
jgi:hypothetical protein